MKGRISWLHGVLGLGLLAVLAMVAASLWQRASRIDEIAGRQDAQIASNQIVHSDSPLPAPSEEPTLEIVIITPPPPGTPIVIPEGKDIQVATLTSFPTPTPIATPTRRPGPTATPIQLATPPDNPAGLIRYAVRTGSEDQSTQSFYTLKIDSSGNVKEPPAPIAIPVEVDFMPYLYIAPNETYIIFMQSVEPGGRPYIYNTLTGKLHSLFENYGGGSFYGWHPDSWRFLFWIDGVGLLLIDAETLDVVTLAYTQGPVQGAAISPDGMTIAYIDSSPTAYTLWFVSSAGSDATPQFDAGAMGYLYPNGWSPNNIGLLYYGDCVARASKSDKVVGGPLCIYNTQTHQKQALTIPFSGFAPSWSPDSRYVVATGLTPGEQECDWKTISAENDPIKIAQCPYQAKSIYIADTQTGESFPLTKGIAPVWSPDGSMLAFFSNQSGQPEIWTIRSDGTDLKQMTSDGWAKTPNSITWFVEIEK